MCPRFAGALELFKAESAVQTDRHKREQREHGGAQVAPMLLVASLFFIAEDIVADNSKERHEHEQQDDHVQHGVTDRVDERCHQNLKPLDERDRPQGARGCESPRQDRSTFTC